MEEKTATVRVFRYDPSAEQEPRYQDYRVPLVEGTSCMDLLDYIYENLDGTLAYYDHAACSLGICGRCTAKINGKARLLCQTPVPEEDPILIEPLSKKKVFKDLVQAKG